MQKTRTILVVDDDANVLASTSDFLNTHDFQAETAHRWTEAVAKINDMLPDAVLLDLHMPTIQGDALLEFIRENHPELPVVMIASQATPEEMARLDALGASGFIRKPFETEDLLLVLEQVLAEFPEEPKLPSPPKAPTIVLNTPDSPPEIQLPENITPGAGVQALNRRFVPTQVQPEKRRRKRTRKHRSKPVGSRFKRVVRYALIIFFFIAMGGIIYLTQKGFGTNYIGGISFGAPPTTTE